MVRMFKRNPNKQSKIDTLIGPKTRINGDVIFAGGFHLDGYINGNVNSECHRCPMWYDWQRFRLPKSKCLIESEASASSRASIRAYS